MVRTLKFLGVTCPRRKVTAERSCPPSTHLSDGESGSSKERRKLLTLQSFLMEEKGVGLRSGFDLEGIENSKSFESIGSSIEESVVRQ